MNNNCKKGFHIKHWSAAKDRQFMCLECLYEFEKMACPECKKCDLTQKDYDLIQCNNPRCKITFGGQLELIDYSDMPNEEVEIIEDGHEHPLGFRKGVVNRDYC